MKYAVFGVLACLSANGALAADCVQGTADVLVGMSTDRITQSIRVQNGQTNTVDCLLSTRIGNTVEPINRNDAMCHIVGFNGVWNGQNSINLDFKGEQWRITMGSGGSSTEATVRCVFFEQKR